MPLLHQLFYEQACYRLPNRHAVLSYVFCAPTNLSVTLQCFCRAMLCIIATYAVMRCPSVCLSVTFVYSVKTSNRILKLFHRRVATPVYFFCTKLYGNIPTGTPNCGVECRAYDFRPISPRLISEMIQDMAIVTTERI